ncbi:hypothetical protein GGI07_002336 [Coemansia sp. Benny D115]|nr:hypothetical protein GGI07_002336 [Coemansia sp. Benny D115]
MDTVSTLLTFTATATAASTEASSAVLTRAISATTTSAAASTTTVPGLFPLPDDPELLSCRLVGPFSIFVQVLVGTLGFSTLLIKRHFEKPRRPWLVWTFDVSKQVIGGTLMHMSNLLVSFLSGQSLENGSATNPCSWYVLNLTLDCTLGVLFVTGYLSLFSRLAKRFGVTGLDSGHYGIPPSWRIWMKQATLFCTSMICMKLTVILLIALLPFLVALGDGILKPVQLLNSPRLEIIFVMALWPLVLNIFESWVLDHLIKKKHSHGSGPIRDGQGFERLPGASFEMVTSTDSVADRTMVGSSSGVRDTQQVSLDLSEFELDTVSDTENAIHENASGRMYHGGYKQWQKPHHNDVYSSYTTARTSDDDLELQSETAGLDPSSARSDVSGGFEDKLLKKQNKPHND